MSRALRSSCARRSAFDAVVLSAILFLCPTAAAFAQIIEPSTEAAPAPQSRPAANICWSEEALAGQPNDKTIIKDIREAYVPPPGDALIPFARVAPGAIRRVELPPGVKKIALTFDNCEQPYEIAGYDSEIVNVLRRNNVPATFFAGGKWMMTHPEQTQQLLADPLFEFGNHSWEHRYLPLLQGQRQIDEIRWAQIAYERQVAALDRRRCIARDGRPFARTEANARMHLFRFPFGACDPAALKAAADLGVVPIQWDISSGDPTKTLGAAEMAAGVVRQARPGSIVLFHANGRGWNTAKALEIIIPQLRAKGFEFATVGELLRIGKFKQESICYDSRPGDVERHRALAQQLDESYNRFYAKFAIKPVAKGLAPTAPQPAPASPPAAP